MLARSIGDLERACARIATRLNDVAQDARDCLTRLEISFLDTGALDADVVAFDAVHVAEMKIEMRH
ncbi:hypothetical protein M446_1188 [Methylobacterium sp. 4-46]|uniref:hypothetical protein n=1 Tax=Methylobacterium sp. CB376 TaxID=3138063 RepID=UPI000165C8DE|nr:MULTISPECIES: hypothetical protein [Methylobacterium]ACA15713.1 hypothetical protein M446_1188 [Methylobacterium sp. 4-46]WFT81448.1 hypothetical protein QA634_06045 [Methylobacterium nodulans]